MDHSDTLPPDVRTTARAVGAELRKRDGYFSPTDYIAAGIMAERARCAALVQAIGNDDLRTGMTKAIRGGQS